MSSPEIQQTPTTTCSSQRCHPTNSARSWTPKRPGSAARWPTWPPTSASTPSETGPTGPGNHPDVMTKVGLINTATMQAKEIVLTRELYDLIPPTPEDLDDTPSVLPDRSELAWNRRWTHTQYRTDPTAEHEHLVTAVWPSPTYSAVFRIKAGYLIAARAEDRLPLPRSEDDPLAADLAQMVYADLRADGLPAGPTQV